MVTVSGRLLDFVEDPSNVAQVQVRAREVRPHGDGVMLDHPVKVDYAPSTGTVAFDAAAGAAGVIMWHAVGRSHASGSLPIVVPDGATATLRECVEAALVADDATVRELERLAAQFADDVEVARRAAATAGKSAYEIAQENGFVGNVVEWLSNLQGADGGQGPIGPRGPQGPPGSISNLDASVTNMAQQAVDLAADDIKWGKELVTDANAERTEGAYFTARDTVGLPAVGAERFGTLEVLPVYGQVTQRFTTWGGGAEIWERGSRTATDWYPWERVDGIGAQAQVATLTEQINQKPNQSEVTQQINDARWPGGIVYDAETQRNFGAFMTAKDTVGLPAIGAERFGTLEVIPVYGQATQRFSTWGTDAQVWQRGARTNGTWYAWERVDGVGIREAASPGTSSTRMAPLSITAPAGGSTQTQADGAVRWVRDWAVMPSRVRIHIRNGNPAWDGNHPPMSLDMVVGPATTTGAMRNTIPLSATLPESGDWVSLWVTLPEFQDGELFGLSIGWEGATASQALMKGGGWVKNSKAGFDSPNTPTTAWARAENTPFYVWVEAEVPATTPVFMVVGDSISIGTATGDPIHEAWPSIYGREHGALPVLMSQHGSGLSSWQGDDVRWRTWFPDADFTVDAVVNALGQNDLNAQSVTLAQMQDWYLGVAAAVRTRFGDVPMYDMAVTPSNKTSAQEVMRRQYNTWLQTQELGQRGYFDAATVLGGLADEDLLPAYSADGIHPNTAGQVAMAGVVSEDPLTPPRLMQASVVEERQIKALTSSRMIIPGTGFPEGRVSAPVGAIYTDTAATNGAIRWIKTSGTGNTGWRVEWGDTGIRALTRPEIFSGGIFRVSRDGAYVQLLIHAATLASDLSAWQTFITVPPGFRPASAFRAQAQDAYLDVKSSGGIAQITTNLSAGKIVSLGVVYRTSDPWPSTLPGTPA